MKKPAVSSADLIKVQMSQMHILCFNVVIILRSQGSKHKKKNLDSCKIHVTEDRYAHTVVHSEQYMWKA